MEFFENYILPILATLISLALTIAIPAFTTIFFQWLKTRGVVIDEARQRMFQTGLEQAAGAALARANGRQVSTIDLQAGVDYLRNGVPGTIATYEKERGRPFTQDELVEKVEAKIASKVATPPAPEVIVQTAAPVTVGSPKIERRVSGRAEI